MKLTTDVGSPIDYEFRVTIRFPYIKLKILYIKHTFCTFTIPPLVCLENMYLFAYKLSYMSQYLEFFKKKCMLIYRLQIWANPLNHSARLL